MNKKIFKDMSFEEQKSHYFNVYLLLMALDKGVITHDEAGGMSFDFLLDETKKRLSENKIINIINEFLNTQYDVLLNLFTNINNDSFMNNTVNYINDIAAFINQNPDEFNNIYQGILNDFSKLTHNSYNNYLSLINSRTDGYSENVNPNNIQNSEILNVGNNYNINIRNETVDKDKNIILENHSDKPNFSYEFIKNFYKDSNEYASNTSFSYPLLLKESGRYNSVYHLSEISDSLKGNAHNNEKSSFYNKTKGETLNNFFRFFSAHDSPYMFFALDNYVNSIYSNNNTYGYQKYDYYNTLSNKNSINLDEKIFVLGDVINQTNSYEKVREIAKTAIEKQIKKLDIDKKIGSAIYDFKNQTLPEIICEKINKKADKDEIVKLVSREIKNEINVNKTIRR